MQKLQGFFLIFLFFTLSPALAALDKPYDHSLWDQFLKNHVNDRGEMNYQAALKDRALLDDYLKKVSKESLWLDWPREEKMAFWLNIYHAALVKTILDHYPVKSIQDIPGVWELQAVRVGELRYSLNRIQDEQLIRGFYDEKIYTAIACSGLSCPKWRKEAFTGPRVEGQLFICTREFVNDPVRNKILPGAKKIWLSRLFQWYEKDFTLDFGAPENDRDLPAEQFAVLSFLSHYLEDAAKVQYLEEGNYKIKYFPFDWTLSEWK